MERRRGDGGAKRWDDRHEAEVNQWTTWRVCESDQVWTTQASLDQVWTNQCWICLSVILYVTNSLCLIVCALLCLCIGLWACHCLTVYV